MINRISWILLLAFGLQTSWGFSPAGPIGNGGDAWQVPTIGFGLGGDLNAPKNFGEEYRRNTPVMYYAFDANFYGFFGPEGATGVGKAFNILNALTNVDNYSKNLSEFPVESRHQNYQAQALGLLDLKSETLGLMAEQLGLADPIRYAWNLHNRHHVGDVACPVGMEYLVVQRNFDMTSSSLTQSPFSPYVNGVLYSYQILEWCETKNSGMPPALAIASPYSADPLADTYSPVASFYLGLGDFYTGFTRDDIAGLRYLLTTNNVNWESSPAGSLQIQTNYNVEQLFPLYAGSTNGAGGGWYNYGDGQTYGTASYAALLNFAQTNDAATLQAAYPGLQFTLLTNYYELTTVTNTVSYYTNFVGGVGTSLVIKKVPSLAFVPHYVYTFDNIVIATNSSATVTAKQQKITIKPMNGAPMGSPSVTNISTKKVKLNYPDADFYILPTNSPCGVDVIASLAFTNYITNVITSTSGTNTTITGTTNTTTATNFTGYAYSEILVIPYVGHVYRVHPITCDSTNQSTGLMRGIGRTSYVRADYDSLLGQFWQPVTNDYTMTMITNSKAVKLSFRRVATQPDFLFTAVDMASGPDALPGVPFGSRNLNFDEANVLPGLAGPGTITTPTVFTYNKAGPVFYNDYSDVMDGTPYFNQTPGSDISNMYYFPYFLWANFDGSTNAPVIFPNGTSLENLQNQVVVQVSPVPNDMPLGAVGVAYALNPPGKFVATGGSFTEPYKWSDPTGVLAGIGLTLAEDGTLSGVPVQDGTFDFTLKLTDAAGRTVDWSYTITIQPNIGG